MWPAGRLDPKKRLHEAWNAADFQQNPEIGQFRGCSNFQRPQTSSRISTWWHRPRPSDPLRPTSGATGPAGASAGSSAGFARPPPPRGPRPNAGCEPSPPRATGRYPWIFTPSSQAFRAARSTKSMARATSMPLSCAGSGASIATLRLATSAISKAHEWAKLESPCRDPGVRASLIRTGKTPRQTPAPVRGAHRRPAPKARPRH